MDMTLGGNQHFRLNEPLTFMLQFYCFMIDVFTLKGFHLFFFIQVKFFDAVSVLNSLTQQCDAHCGPTSLWDAHCGPTPLWDAQLHMHCGLTLLWDAHCGPTPLWDVHCGPTLLWDAHCGPTLLWDAHCGPTPLWHAHQSWAHDNSVATM